MVAFCCSLSTTGGTVGPFFFMMGWNPSGNSAGTQHAVMQKPLSVLRPVLRHIPRRGALMDKWGSGSSAVSPDVYFFRHACLRASAPPSSMHLQPCNMRLGGLIVRVHHVLSCVRRRLVDKLCCSWLPGHKHVDMRVGKPGQALRSVLSQFVRFLLSQELQHHRDMLKTLLLKMFSGHLTSHALYAHHQGPGVAGILFMHFY